MEVLLKETKPALDFEAGDMLVSDKGKCALVGMDMEDDSSFRAMVLGDNLITSFWYEKQNLLDGLFDEDFGEVVRVVKSSNLKLVEI